MRRSAVGNRVAAAALALLLGAGAAAAAGFGPLLTPMELAAEVATEAAAPQPVVLDIRDQGYAEGHLPGAVSAPYASFRGPAENAGQVPGIEVLEARFESYGLATDRPVVIVPDGRTDTDFGAAARVYWTLKSTGFEEIAILNGGTQGWIAAGLPLETAEVTPQPTELSLSFDEKWTAPTEEVSAIVEGRDRAILVDARPVEYYEGQTKVAAAARPGTLPGAESYPYTAFFADGSAAITPKQDGAALKRLLGVTGDEEVVAFCNTGHWAATEWFALSELAGIENVKLYPGSMVEYSQAGLPMENVPGLFTTLRRQVFGN